MLLSEIANANHVKNSGSMFFTIMANWNNLIKKGVEYTVKGKIEQFEVRSIKTKPFVDTYLFFALFDLKNSRYVAAVDLTTFGKNLRTWQVGEVGVASEYHGMNLSVKLYTWVVTKENLILVSGMEQSLGGKSIWERLANVPSIFIFGYDVRNKKSFQVDQTDLFNEDVYIDGMTTERDYLQKEFNNIENKLDSLDPDTTPELTFRKFDKTLNTLSDQIAKLDVAISHAEDYIRLVAIKSKK